MRRRVFGPVASALLFFVLAACGQNETESEIELTSPAQSAAEMETNFGETFAETARADPSSVPKDPDPDSLPPVSYTAEPIPVPAE